MIFPVLANELKIQLAVEILRQGKLVALPTETVYGLGADAKNTDAVNKVFVAKGRPADHPLIVHIADVGELPKWAVQIPQSAYKLAEKYWPGPITLVLKKHPDVPDEVTGGQDTVALRVPNHPVALAVLKAFGGGIAAPSANRFCRISPTQASHVEEELGDKVDMILDGGACEVGLESTIVDLSGGQPKLLRPGHISQTEIEGLLQTKLELPEDNEQIHAPGRLEVHYAPNKIALLCSSEQVQKMLQGNDFGLKHKKIGIISYGTEIGSELFAEEIRLPEHAKDYGQLLYSKLRELDHADLDLILIEQPPQSDDWKSVNDRLKKATKPLMSLSKVSLITYDMVDASELTRAAYDWAQNSFDRH